MSMEDKAQSLLAQGRHLQHDSYVMGCLYLSSPSTLLPSIVCVLPVPVGPLHIIKEAHEHDMVWSCI